MPSTVAIMTDEDGPRFDPAGPGLVYVLLADDIAAKITAGTLTSGARLAGVVDMAEDYHVSRATVRRAVRELRDRGLVHTVTGKGTYVI